MITSINGYRGISFNRNLHPIDISYKKELINGLSSKYRFTPNFEDMSSILAPNQLKSILKKMKPKNFSLGKVCFKKEAKLSDFEDVIKGVHKINLHIHTNNSDGSMNIDEYLYQAKHYADRVESLNKNSDTPFYVSAITDHNNIDGVQEVISKIAQEPQKYKNFKFVPGCEFMFNDDNCGFNFTAFEAVGLGFNPFDKSLNENLSRFNMIDIIPKIKEFGGILSYAHPVQYCQGNGIESKFIEYLKKIGINAIESNYQYLDFEKDAKILNLIVKIKKIAKENGFFETGGTDTHSGNIFHFKARNFIDKLI